MRREGGHRGSPLGPGEVVFLFSGADASTVSDRQAICRQQRSLVTAPELRVTIGRTPAIGFSGTTPRAIFPIRG
jgi:hypothetical protein